MSTRSRSLVVASVMIASLVLAREALAGPPLICHPYDTGGAPSLPWAGHGWADAQTDYNLANLVGDTQALLTPSTPIIVRMETLRRASIYASRDPQIAGNLLHGLTARARESRLGHPDALALLDAAYVAAALRQVVQVGGIAPFRSQAEGIRRVIADVDPWELVTASLAARPGDPSLEFAAALIATGAKPAAYAAHAQRAREGAGTDALLARNLSHIS